MLHLRSEQGQVHERCLVHPEIRVRVAGPQLLQPLLKPNAIRLIHRPSVHASQPEVQEQLSAVHLGPAWRSEFSHKGFRGCPKHLTNPSSLVKKRNHRGHRHEQRPLCRRCDPIKKLVELGNHQSSSRWSLTDRWHLGNNGLVQQRVGMVDQFSHVQRDIAFETPLGLHLVLDHASQLPNRCGLRLEPQCNKVLQIAPNLSRAAGQLLELSLAPALQAMESFLVLHRGGKQGLLQFIKRRMSRLLHLLGFGSSALLILGRPLCLWIRRLLRGSARRGIKFFHQSPRLVEQWPVHGVGPVARGGLVTLCVHHGLHPSPHRRGISRRRWLPFRWGRQRRGIQRRHHVQTLRRGRWGWQWFSHDSVVQIHQDATGVMVAGELQLHQPLQGNSK
mmetsp:Transcript_32605/g.71147  ORF Transcript_32605/g.71147 Transcript_32605/m.71147 type:complete len:390 (-) Transcript_32605:30-1199(-)